MLGRPNLVTETGLGIEVVADLAGVGRNLQDHPMVMVSCAGRPPLPPSRYNHGEMYATLRSGPRCGPARVS